MHKHKHIFINHLLLCILFFALYSCSPSKQCLKSEWQNNLQTNKSTTEGFIALSNPSVLVKISNNKQAILIDIKFSNKELQFKTLLNGLTVWIDTTGKTKKKFAIQFPQANIATEGMQRKAKNNTGLNITNLISGINFEGALLVLNDEEIPLQTKEANVYIDDNNMLTYSIMLPYSKLSNYNFSQKQISIGIVSERKEMPRPTSDDAEDEMPRGAGHEGGMLGGGQMGGGMPSGGSHGGGMRNRPQGSRHERNSQQKSSDTIKEWITVTLSSN